MIHRIGKYFSALALLAAFSSAPLAHAEPENREDYVVSQGLVDIPDQSFVQGSHRQGGIQPDYAIDLGHPQMQRLLKFARKLKAQEPDVWKRINRINLYIRKRHLKGYQYDNPRYTGLNKKYLEMQKDVPLGEYSACRAGVCRENALFLHFALKEAGIENYHGYAQIQRRSWRNNFDIVEDHAFVVSKVDGELWVIDSYYRGFNGYKLKDLMSKRGITPKSPMAPIAQELVGFRRIMKINTFPEILSPKALPVPAKLNVRKAFRPPGYEPCENYYRDLRVEQ